MLDLLPHGSSKRRSAAAVRLLATSLLLALALPAPAPAYEPICTAEPLYDVNQEPLGSEPRYFTEHGGLVYFMAFESATGRELWRSDGTFAGTGIVADVCPGPCSSNPNEHESVGALLYFRASTPETGDELWVTDGTQAGISTSPHTSRRPDARSGAPTGPRPGRSCSWTSSRMRTQAVPPG